jgi:NAD(P)-dependent dehydrogenase (short-subunit alcohol dehydrogenase family)
MTNETIENRSARTAIITGGSRGIGRNTAVNLARRGVDIIFTYYSNQAEAESLVREVETMGRKVAAYRLDTGDVSSFSRFLAEVRNTLQNWGRVKHWKFEPSSERVVGNARYRIPWRVAACGQATALGSSAATADRCKRTSWADVLR